MWKLLPHRRPNKVIWSTKQKLPMSHQAHGRLLLNFNRGRHLLSLIISLLVWLLIQLMSEPSRHKDISPPCGGDRVPFFWDHHSSFPLTLPQRKQPLPALLPNLFLVTIPGCCELEPGHSATPVSVSLAVLRAWNLNSSYILKSILWTCSPQ